MTKLTVYDFDKTIYNGETLSNFYKFYLRKKPLKFFTSFLQLYYFILYILKIISLEKLKEKFLQFLNGENIENLKKYIEEFWNENENKINSWVQNEISENKKVTELLIAVSASPTFLIQDKLKKIGFDLVIGTDFLFEGEKFHSKILSKNCKNEEKVKRLNEWAKTNKIDYEIVNFYSDSIADKPLFDIAKNKFWINKGKIENGMPMKKTILDKIFWK